MAAELGQVIATSASRPAPRNPFQKGFAGFSLFLCRARNFRRFELRKKGRVSDGVRREVQVCAVFRE